jgi:hypothetical protein
MEEKKVEHNIYKQDDVDITHVFYGKQDFDIYKILAWNSMNEGDWKSNLVQIQTPLQIDIVNSYKSYFSQVETIHKNLNKDNNTITNLIQNLRNNPDFSILVSILEWQEKLKIDQQYPINLEILKIPHIIEYLKLKNEDNKELVTNNIENILEFISEYSKWKINLKYQYNYEKIDKFFEWIESLGHLENFKKSKWNNVLNLEDLKNLKNEYYYSDQSSEQLGITRFYVPENNYIDWLKSKNPELDTNFENDNEKLTYFYFDVLDILVDEEKREYDELLQTKWCKETFENAYNKNFIQPYKVEFKEKFDIDLQSNNQNEIEAEISRYFEDDYFRINGSKADLESMKNQIDVKYQDLLRQTESKLEAFDTEYLKLAEFDKDEEFLKIHTNIKNEFINNSFFQNYEYKTVLKFFKIIRNYIETIEERSLEYAELCNRYNQINPYINALIDILTGQPSDFLKNGLRNLYKQEYKGYYNNIFKKNGNFQDGIQDPMNAVEFENGMSNRYCEIVLDTFGIDNKEIRDIQQNIDRDKLKKIIFDYLENDGSGVIPDNTNDLDQIVLNHLQNKMKIHEFDFFIRDDKYSLVRAIIDFSNVNIIDYDKLRLDTKSEYKINNYNDIIHVINLEPKFLYQIIISKITNTKLEDIDILDTKLDIDNSKILEYIKDINNISLYNRNQLFLDFLKEYSFNFCEYYIGLENNDKQSILDATIQKLNVNMGKKLYKKTFYGNNKDFLLGGIEENKYNDLKTEDIAGLICTQENVIKIILSELAEQDEKVDLRGNLSIEQLNEKLVKISVDEQKHIQDSIIHYIDHNNPGMQVYANHYYNMLKELFRIIGECIINLAKGTGIALCICIIVILSVIGLGFWGVWRGSKIAWENIKGFGQRMIQGTRNAYDAARAGAGAAYDAARVRAGDAYNSARVGAVIGAKVIGAIISSVTVLGYESVTRPIAWIFGKIFGRQIDISLYNILADKFPNIENQVNQVIEKFTPRFVQTFKDYIKGSEELRRKLEAGQKVYPHPIRLPDIGNIDYSPTQEKTIISEKVVQKLDLIDLVNHPDKKESNMFVELVDIHNKIVPEINHIKIVKDIDMNMVKKLICRYNDIISVQEPWWGKTLDRFGTKILSENNLLYLEKMDKLWNQNGPFVSSLKKYYPQNFRFKSSFLRRYNITFMPDKLQNLLNTTKQKTISLEPFWFSVLNMAVNKYNKIENSIVNISKVFTNVKKDEDFTYEVIPDLCNYEEIEKRLFMLYIYLSRNSILDQSSIEIPGFRYVNDFLEFMSDIILDSDVVFKDNIDTNEKEYAYNIYYGKYRKADEYKYDMNIITSNFKDKWGIGGRTTINTIIEETIKLINLPKVNNFGNIAACNLRWRNGIYKGVEKRDTLVQIFSKIIDNYKSVIENIDNINTSKTACGRKWDWYDTEIKFLVKMNTFLEKTYVKCFLIRHYPDPQMIRILYSDLKKNSWYKIYDYWDVMSSLFKFQNKEPFWFTEEIKMISKIPKVLVDAYNDIADADPSITKINLNTAVSGDIDDRLNILYQNYKDRGFVDVISGPLDYSFTKRHVSKTAFDFWSWFDVEKDAKIRFVKEMEKYMKSVGKKIEGGFDRGKSYLFQNIVRYYNVFIKCEFGDPDHPLTIKPYENLETIHKKLADYYKIHTRYEYFTYKYALDYVSRRSSLVGINPVDAPDFEPIVFKLTEPSKKVLQEMWGDTVDGFQKDSQVMIENVVYTLDAVSIGNRTITLDRAYEGPLEKNIAVYRYSLHTNYRTNDGALTNELKYVGNQIGNGTYVMIDKKWNKISQPGNILDYKIEYKDDTPIYFNISGAYNRYKWLLWMNDYNKQENILGGKIKDLKDWDYSFWKTKQSKIDYINSKIQSLNTSNLNDLKNLRLFHIQYKKILELRGGWNLNNIRLTPSEYTQDKNYPDFLTTFLIIERDVKNFLLTDGFSGIFGSNFDRTKLLNINITPSEKEIKDINQVLNNYALGQILGNEQTNITFQTQFGISYYYLKYIDSKYRIYDLGGEVKESNIDNLNHNYTFKNFNDIKIVIDNSEAKCFERKPKIEIYNSLFAKGTNFKENGKFYKYVSIPANRNSPENKNFFDSMISLTKKYDGNLSLLKTVEDYKELYPKIDANEHINIMKMYDEQLGAKPEIVFKEYFVDKLPKKCYEKLYIHYNDLTNQYNPPYLYKLTLKTQVGADGKEYVLNIPKGYETLEKIQTLLIDFFEYYGFYQHPNGKPEKKTYPFSITKRTDGKYIFEGTKRYKSDPFFITQGNYIRLPDVDIDYKLKIDDNFAKLTGFDKEVELKGKMESKNRPIDPGNIKMVTSNFLEAKFSEEKNNNEKKFVYDFSIYTKKWYPEIRLGIELRPSVIAPEPSLRKIYIKKRSRTQKSLQIKVRKTPPSSPKIRNSKLRKFLKSPKPKSPKPKSPKPKSPKPKSPKPKSPKPKSPKPKSPKSKTSRKTSNKTLIKTNPVNVVKPRFSKSPVSKTKYKSPNRLLLVRR